MLSSIAYVLSSSVWGLFLVRIFQGAAAAMVLPVVLAYVAEISPPEREGTYMGIMNFAFFAGLSFGPILGGVIYDWINIQATFYVLGFFSAVSLLIVIALLPSQEPWRNQVKRPAKLFDVKLIKVPIIGGISFFRLAISYGVGLNWSFLPLYAENQLQLTGSQIGAILSVNVLISALFQGPAGILADKTNRRKIVFWGGSFQAIAFIMIPFCKNFELLLFANLIIGLGGGVALPALMAITAVEGKSLGMGSVMATITSFHSYGIILGSITGGLMYDLLGFAPAYIMAALVGLSGSLVFFHLSKNYRASN